MKHENYEIEDLQRHLEMLRKLFGWSAEQLGNRLGVTKQTILNLEHGKAKMSKIQYIAIRSVMETEAKLREEEEKANLLQVLSIVFKEDKNMTEEQREKALEVSCVAATATFNGVASMGVLAAGLLGIGLVAAFVPDAGSAVSGGITGWLTSMLNDVTINEYKIDKK